jgi:hypothetical protein
MDLWVAPPVLIIHLKRCGPLMLLLLLCNYFLILCHDLHRFQEHGQREGCNTRRGRGITRSKLNTFVQFPTVNLNLSEHMGTRYCYIRI